eukprot:g15043.t1
MNLRQAKDAIAVRDEEARRLRAAVIYLERTLCSRERELRDTVLCLRGTCPARPHQEWLQEGTPSSRLRLQADEYHTEAKRLARALAAVTGGNGGSGRISAGLNVDKLFPRKTDAGDPVAAAGCSGVGLVEAPQRPSNKTNAGSLARGKGGEGGQEIQPPLAWEATVGAAIRESSGASGGMRRRDSTHDSHFVPRTSDVLDDIGIGLATFAPPVAAMRGGVPRRRAGKTSDRAVRRGSSGGNLSPDRWSSYSEKKRSSCMAASARFRASVRKSVAERNELLALNEEARRLQTARAERARRARLARQKIARYREERIHELESRLARSCGREPQDAGDTTETVPPEMESRDGGNDTCSASSDEGDADRGEDGGGNPGDAGIDRDSKLQRLSRQRKEIEAAIAAAMEENLNSRWSLSAEDEVQESNGYEDGSHEQRVYGGEGTRGGDAFRGPSISADETGPGYGARTDPAADSEAAARGPDDAAWGGAEYLEDSFEGSEREGQEDGVPFAVSSPSDDETEAFAAGRESLTERSAAVPVPAADEHQYRRDQDQDHDQDQDQNKFRADANTESNEWLINEPPGHLRRPLPVAGETPEPERALLRPVLPTTLRYDSEDTAEAGTPKTFETAHHSSTPEPVAMKTGGKSDGVGLARDKREGQRSTDQLRHDTRTAGQTRDETKPGKTEKEGIDYDDAVAPLRIDSTVLFASLSSSTEAATISSKSIKKEEGKGFNPTRELAGVRRDEESSSTFALSADDANDDNDGTVPPASDRGNNVTLQSSAPFDAKRPPAKQHGSVAIENSLAASPSANHSNGALSAEASRRSDSSPSPGNSGSLDGVPVEGIGSGPTPSPRAAFPPPQDEIVLSSRENPTMASLRQSPRDRDLQVSQENGEIAPSPQSSVRLRLSPSPLGEAAKDPAITKPDADVSTHSAEGDYGTLSGRKEDEGGDAADRREEGATLDRGGRNNKAEDAGFDEGEGLAGGSSPREREGSVVGALGEGLFVDQGSSHGGSVLDVGGGGVDGPVDDDDDDDGYF